MKKIIFLLSFLSVLFSQSAFAQPSYYISPAQLEVDEDASFCVDLKTEDFTSMIGLSFTIKFDPDVLVFTSVSNFNPMVTGLDINDFGLSTATDGYITFIWSNGEPCQSATTGITIPPDLEPATLFTLCFTAIGDYGEHSAIEITDSPIDLISLRESAGCFPIGEEYVGDGFVSIGTSPLTINISSTDGYHNDTVCVDFKVEDFTNLISSQYYIFWDTTILEYYSATKLTLGNNGDQYQINYSPAYGMLASIWYNGDPNQGVSLPDGTAILQMCFRVKGNCGQSSPIYISYLDDGINLPEPVEVIDEITGDPNSGVNLGLLQTEGLVSVNCNDPNSITIDMDSKNVCPGEDFTVDVKVSNFSQIVQLTYDLKWNPNIIQLDTVTYPPQSGGPLCLPFSNGVDDNDALSLGLLHMDWMAQGQGCNKPNGYILMRLHFKAIGPSGSNSTIAVVDPIFVDKFGGQPSNIGINNHNSLVSLCELSQPTITASSENANPGTQICVEFNVQDFDDLTSMGYTIAWEPSILQFTGVQNLNLTGLTMSDFLTGQAASLGVLGLDWSNGTGVTVPDGVTIFSVCFNVIGDPGECTPVSIEDTPWPITVTTATPNAGNIGLNGQPGQVCVLDPFVLNLSLPDTYGGPFSTVCIDMSVDNFKKLTNTEYSINWNPNILEFISLTPSGSLPNFTTGSFDASNATSGNLTIDWAATNQVLGTTVPDGTEIFELCFKLIGDPNDCSPVTVSSYPTEVIINSATTGSSNLNISTIGGSICIGGTISLVGYDVTDVSCGSAPDGSITLNVEGGSGQYGYSWSGPGVSPTAANQTNLNIGNFIVTVTDMQNPALKIIQPFNIGYTADAIYANAGQDTTRSCNNNSFLLNGTASAMGAGITYSWKKLGLGVITGGETTLTPSTFGSGAFELTVTGANCVDKDTVVVTGSQTPIPNILPAETISCKNDIIDLDGSLSPFINGFEINWSGPGVVPGTEHEFIAQASQPGWYYMTLSNANTNCIGIDSVEVLGNLTLPTADAGQDTVLGCNTSFVPIGGASSTGSNFLYDWIPMGAGQLCGNPQAATLNACSPGSFELTVTDTLNGCSATDIIVVTADTLKPISNAGADKVLNCLVDMVTLDGSASSTGANFDHTWRLAGAIIAQGSLNVNVSTPGIYELEVMDNSNGCSAVSEVEVTEEKQAPAIAASHSNDISCLQPSATLDATGSATGTTISYDWINSLGVSVDTGLTITVNAPDDYVLVVTDSENGCTSTNTVSVADLTTPPAASAAVTGQITCDGPATIVGTYNENNPNLKTVWSGPGLGCIANPDAASTTVTCSGGYVFHVYDESTGCEGTFGVNVVEDLAKPTANAGPDGSLPCAGSSVTLQGSTNITDFSLTWTFVPTGATVGNSTDLNPTVTQVGQYALLVESNVNGCISNPDYVQISQDVINFVANAGNDGTIDCLTPLWTLDASGSTFSGNDDIAWQGINGTTFTSNQVTVQVPDGTYLLTISTPEGCSDQDTVVVNKNIEAINVTANASGILSCGNQSVDLTGSSNSSGTNLSFVWTNESGMIAGNGETIAVSTQGTYTLTVTNPANGCSGTASVQVLQDNSNLEQASAQADYVNCESEATLIGNLPAGTTGLWTTLTGATIGTPTSETATASNFSTGENQFVWTLSLGDCPNYSADTVSFDVNQTTPNAVDDNTSLQPGTGGQISLNVLENDDFTAGNISFELLPNTVFGTVTSSPEGEVTYVKEKCVAGKVTIPYKICDLTCPDLCDDATLTIDVLSDPEEACGETPNGITPNGDGINDELIFDELLNTSENYPDNEIVIFNRWGDVVFQAKPYLNNWAGTNNGGQDLPQATYYYILRLKIADGLILKGDVTILK